MTNSKEFDQKLQKTGGVFKVDMVNDSMFKVIQDHRSMLSIPLDLDKVRDFNSKLNNKQLYLTTDMPGLYLIDEKTLKTCAIYLDIYKDGIDIAVEMLYDKMDAGEFLNDVAQMLKNNFTAEDFIFDGAEIVLNKIDGSENVIFSSTYTVVEIGDEDEKNFDLIRTDGSVSELALPTEDECTIKDGKLYIDCVEEGVLEIKLRK